MGPSVTASRRWNVAAAALLVLALLAVVPPAQAAANAGGRPCQVDVMLVMDVSGSMLLDSPTRIQMARLGATNFVNVLRPSYDQSGLVAFEAVASMRQTLTFNHAATAAQIGALAAGGNTNMGDAIDLAHGELLVRGRPDARPIIVALTDGESNTGPDPVAEATQAKADGIEIFVIAVGSTVSTGTTQGVASAPAATYWRRAVVSSDVDDAFDEILEYVVPLCADFEAVPACVGEPVVFTDLSRILPPRTISNARWDFDDGTRRTLSPPQATVHHTYSASGTYNVTLNVTSSVGEWDLHWGHVTVDNCPVADFECEGLYDPYLRIRFTDRSVDLDGDIVSWRWVLGDGIVSTEQNPSYDYATPGWRTVTLTVTDAQGHVSSVTKTCIAFLNLPPRAWIGAEHHVMSGRTLIVPMGGSDPENHTLSFHMAGFPSWVGQSDGDGSLAAVAPLVAAATPFPGEVWVEESDTRDRFASPRVPTTIWVHPPPPPTAEPVDSDRDGLLDVYDNCTFKFNDEQGDGDADGTGDACIPRATGGGREPALARPTAPAYDAAGGAGPDPDMTAAGTAAGAAAAAGDADGDGLPDALDLCPQVQDEGDDADGDGTGDACDPDLDGDGAAQVDAVGRRLDNCPLASNPDQRDTDRDGRGDACDAGGSGDGGNTLADEAAGNAGAAGRTAGSGAGGAGGAGLDGTGGDLGGATADASGGLPAAVVYGGFGLLLLLVAGGAMLLTRRR